MDPFLNSLQGRLILDSGKLAGSYFDRTVVLVCHQDETGSFGLVLNKPLGRSLKSVTDSPMGAALGMTPVYQGGPVQPEMFSVLYEMDSPSEDDVLSGLRLGHSLKELCSQFESNNPPRRLRAYAGYAGWTGGQLEKEMREECWISLPALPGSVFCEHPETLWSHLLKEQGGVYELLANFPTDPSRN